MNDAPAPGGPGRPPQDGTPSSAPGPWPPAPDLPLPQARPQTASPQASHIPAAHPHTGQGLPGQVVPAPSPPRPQSGGVDLPETIGPYRPVELIGSGGMGQVFRARTGQGGVVAVKTLHPHLVDQGDSRERLRREVETMGRVSTPRVAEIVDFDADARVPYIVTRFVEGRPLLDEVRDAGPMNGAALWRVAIGTAEALAAIHAAGIVHRDIKPGNVLLEAGEPVVIDFGISQGIDDTRLTHSGGRSGTWRYLAPEMLEGADASPGADVFAWAAMVAFASTGVDLYDAPNDAAVCVRIIRGDHDLGDVPAELNGLLAESLVADPAARPSADTLARRLRALRPDSIGLGRRRPSSVPGRSMPSGSMPGAAVRGPSGVARAKTEGFAPIGPYRPLQQLGRGGMGEVFLARADDGRMVAIKTLLPFLPAEFQAKDRLRREVEAMRRIRNPHVVELVDHDMDADPPYIVTRYVEGTPLHDIVMRHGPLDRDRLLKLAGGVAGALAAVHETAGVHRDVNPSNIMMVGDEPVIIDFGIAYVSGAAPLTRGPIGTPGYVAPEVLEGKQVGPPADVFAWAATVAFAATGRRAYEATSPAAFVRRVLNGEPDLDGITGDLREILQEALVRDPEARPASSELAERFSNPGQIAPRLSRTVEKADAPPQPEAHRPPPPSRGGREAFLQAGMALTVSVIEVSLTEAKRDLGAAERCRALGGAQADHAQGYARRALASCERAVRDAQAGTGIPANAPRLAEIIRAARMYAAHAKSVLSGRSLLPGQLVDVRRVVTVLGGARFTRVRFKEGYDPAEVDAFVAEVATWLTGDRRQLSRVVGADDVRSREFTVRRLREAYVREEVDAFLTMLEKELRRLGYA
ncbi:protein kinase domain-containing protein [Spirillospora sp. CA-294931]|uniref:protein kinase domain-containing protein n=1 Tax=Spirillospora sp. CA-294931 TaxID=3240042 RepID=UPI003D8B1EC2